MEKIYIDGCMWEDEAWIEFDTKVSYSEPCKHCYGHKLEEHTRHGGSTYTRAIWYCPRVIVVTNEGGCNSTGVCLDCVIEAAGDLERNGKCVQGKRKEAVSV
jgi:hypothetical protein